MPIPLPNLDDRTYAELTAEARALIPTVHPGWTNHNPSDPGIVLVELLAWLTEMLLFQVNELPDASTEAFLRLLNGRDWAAPEGNRDEAVVRTIQGLRERYRAATVDDVEQLALHTWPASPEAAALGDAARIARVRAVPRRNLETDDPAARSEPAPAHVSLVVVPAASGGEDTHPQPPAPLLAGLAAFLAPRRTLTTRLGVVGPSYVDVGITVVLALHEDAPPADALVAVRQALGAFFDPLAGGPAGTGWPFGRDVHASEVYATLEHVGPVNYVDDVGVSGPRVVADDEGKVVSVELDAHELVRLAGLEVTAYDSTGNPHTFRTGGS